MTHYSETASHCRIDFFKPSGKWYMTEMLDMNNFWKSEPGLGNLTPMDAVKNSMNTTDRHQRILNEGYFTIVVLDPYFEHAYPVCIPSKKLMEI